MRAPSTVAIRAAAALILVFAVSGGKHGAAAEPAAVAADASPSSGGPLATIRTGDHPGFGRVVLDLPSGMTATVAQEGGNIALRLSDAAVPKLLGRPPRNVLGIAVRPGGAVLTLGADTALRQARLAGRLVLDVLDSAQAATSPPSAARRRPVRPSPSIPVPTLPPAGKTEPAAMAPPAPGSVVPVPVAPVPVEATPLLPPGPVEIMASAPPDEQGGEISLPFSTGTSAAAFRRGGIAILVFDERRPIDMSLLRDHSVFGAATVRLLPDATVIELPLADPARLRLDPGAQGWRVAIVPGPIDPSTARTIPIRIATQDGIIHFAASGPGRVVSVPDEATGATLLVGTQHVAGENVAAARQVPGVILLKTWQGVALEPITDALVLRPDPSGFTAAAGVAGRPLALSADDGNTGAVADASSFSQRYGFPSASAESLGRRLEAAVAAAAATPLQSRGPKRLQVAKLMLGLGLGPEARSVLSVAASDEPQLADDPDVVGLQAVAALVAGNPDDAHGIDDPRLDGTDDIALWRAIRAATVTDSSPGVAQTFAATVPLLLSYPAGLRDRFLPLAVETMLLNGEPRAAHAVLSARADDPHLALARAIETDQSGGQQGDRQRALAAYDDLARGGDRLLSVRAARRAIDLRLATHAMTPAEAADAMDKLIYAWRGDRRELATRYRTVELRQQARQWRQALALLRDTEQAWPDESASVRSRLQTVFADAVRADEVDGLPPIEMVELAEENADLVAQGDDGGVLAARLADRLAALDLPARSAAVLDRLMSTMPTGPGRAAIGQSLARRRLDLGDAPAALAALAASVAPELSPPLVAHRTMTEAEALAAEGDLPSALNRLAALDGPEADDLRARLAEQRGAWPEAEAALRRYTREQLPAEGVFDPGQAALAIRLASAAAQSGDEATLSELRRRWSSRLPPGETARLFDILTERPVQDTTDLPRAAREVTLARTLNAGLTSGLDQPRPASGRPIAAR